MNEANQVSDQSRDISYAKLYDLENQMVDPLDYLIGFYTTTSSSASSSLQVSEAGKSLNTANAAISSVNNMSSSANN